MVGMPGVYLSIQFYSLLGLMAHIHMATGKLAPVVGRPSTDEHQQVELFVAAGVLAVEVAVGIGDVAFQLRAEQRVGVYVVPVGHLLSVGEIAHRNREVGIGCNGLAILALHC